MTDAEILNAVDGYVHSQGQSPEYWTVYQVYESAPERLINPLIAVVLDPSSDSRPISSTDTGSSKESPLERALSFIKPGKHEELIPRLVKLASSSDSKTRQTAARHLLPFLNSQVLEAIGILAEDPDDWVVTSVAAGLHYALKKSPVPAGYRERLVKPLENIVRHRRVYTNLAPTTLLQLDPEHGAKVLSELIAEGSKHTEDYFAAFSRTEAKIDEELLLQIVKTFEADLDTAWKTPRLVEKCRCALHALNRQQTKYDDDLLFRIVESYVPKPENVLAASLYGQALIGLAKRKHPRTKPLINQILEEPPSSREQWVSQEKNERLKRQEYAARALLAFEEFSIPEEKLEARKEKLGLDRLSQLERDLEIVNSTSVVWGDGFDGYFESYGKDHVREEIAALERMGASRHANILRKACSVFGWFGPSSNDEKRRKQIEALSDKDAGVLSACAQALFDCPESLEVKRMLYALKHRKELEELK